jgi:hypothetical protein
MKRAVKVECGCVDTYDINRKQGTNSWTGRRFCAAHRREKLQRHEQLKHLERDKP